MGILRKSKSTSSVPVPIKSLNFAQQQRDEEVFKSVNEIEKLACGRQASEAAAKHACRMALEPKHLRRHCMLFDEPQAQVNDFPVPALNTNEFMNDTSGVTRETSFRRTTSTAKPSGVMQHKSHNKHDHRPKGPSVRGRNEINLGSTMSSTRTMRGEQSKSVRKSLSMGNLRRKLSRNNFTHRKALKSPRSCVDFSNHDDSLISKSSMSGRFWNSMKAAFIASANAPDRDLPPQQVFSNRKHFHQSSRVASPLYNELTGEMTPLPEGQILHMESANSQKPSFSKRLPSGFQIKRLFSALWKEINPHQASANELNEFDMEADLNAFARDESNINIFPKSDSDGLTSLFPSSQKRSRLASDTTMETMVFRTPKPMDPSSPLGPIDLNSQRIRIPRPARFPSVQKKKSDETTSIYSQPEGPQFVYPAKVGLRSGISRDHIDWERMKARASLNAKTLTREQMASIPKKHSDGDMEDRTKRDRMRAWSEDVAAKSDVMSLHGQENRMPFF